MKHFKLADILALDNEIMKIAIWLTDTLSINAICAGRTCLARRAGLKQKYVLHSKDYYNISFIFLLSVESKHHELPGIISYESYPLDLRPLDPYQSVGFNELQAFFAQAHFPAEFK